MTLQQLEYVVAIDKYRHFVKAAESCGITQSTLSSMLRKLEEELDLTLFDRNSHPIRPTLAGEEIIKQAKVVLFHSKQLQEMSLSERKKETGHIKLGVTTTVAPYVMPKLFKYIKDIPDLDITAFELYRDEIVRMLKNADLDMAIMSLPGNEPDLLEIPPLQRETLGLRLPARPAPRREGDRFHQYAARTALGAEARDLLPETNHRARQRLLRIGKKFHIRVRKHRDPPTHRGRKRGIHTDSGVTHPITAGKPQK